MLSPNTKSFAMDAAVLKRKSLRQAPNVPLRVFNREDGSRLGPIGNISVDGLMLFSASQLLPNEIYPMAMVLPVSIKGSRSVAFDGECVWCEYSEDRATYVAGFSLDGLDKSSNEILQVLIRSYAI
ncbi:MAG: PilZ domain-containing protein [Pseudomonadales bacterium]|nr:PilZ domain-containing protein [Pseudomonadales bacterium]